MFGHVQENLSDLTEEEKSRYKAAYKCAQISAALDIRMDHLRKSVRELNDREERSCTVQKGKEI